jgi:gliding motility-associated protein GldM
LFNFPANFVLADPARTLQAGQQPNTMASGKETPRQKMIGMMYLVLTALLALNVSKDILQAFVVVNGSLEKTNENFTQKTDGQYSAFDNAKKIDVKKVQAYWDKAQAVRKLSKEMVAYIEGIKKKVMGNTDGLTDQEADSVHLNYINSKDNYDIATNIMIGNSEDGSKGMSRELKDKLNGFKDKLYGFILPGDRKDVHLGINTADPEHSEENENWELYNFYHTPLAAVVTILSKFQNDVKKSESDVVEYLFRHVNYDDFVFDTIAAKIITPTNYVLLGEEYNADVFVAAFSKTQNPTVKVGDYDMENKKFNGAADSIYVERGSGKYKVKTSREGIFKWGGEVTLISPQGNKHTYPFQSEYVVARPSLTVSADNMNVFYKGIDNPVSVSVPGVPLERITATIDNGTLIKTTNGKYIVKVMNGKVAHIHVSAKMENGETKQMGSIEYRLKSLPDPIPSLNGMTGGTIKITLTKLKAVQGIGVSYGESFDFKANAMVKSFTMTFKSGGGEEIPIKLPGQMFNQKVKDMIYKLKPGSKFYIDDIVTVGPDGVEHTSSMKVLVQ